MSSDSDREILLRRASLLAPVPKVQQAVALQEFLFFSVGDRPYGLPTEQVSAVVPVSDSDITYLPGAPTAILGVHNVRGRIVPVVDLCYLLGNQKVDHGFQRLILVDLNGVQSALMANAIEGVRALKRDQLHAVPSSWPEHQRRHLQMITESGEPILQIEALLADQTLGFLEGEEEA